MLKQSILLLFIILSWSQSKAANCERERKIISHIISASEILFLNLEQNKSLVKSQSLQGAKYLRAWNIKAQNLKKLVL